MRERQAIVAEMAIRYKRAAKRERGLILDEAVKLLGYNRAYAARALRQVASVRRRWKNVQLSRRRGRAPVYADPAVQKALRTVWAVMGFPCGRRLAEVVAALERHGELSLSPQVRPKLLGISGATIDRWRKADRKRMGIGGRSGTKPGSLLKEAIPTKTFADWEDTQPGFLQIDLVGHDGGVGRGDYA